MARCKHFNICGLEERRIDEGYCILHSPDLKKDRAAFDTALRHHQDTRGHNYGLMVFASDVFFISITFSELTDFHGVNFNDAVYFNEATFCGDAIFNSTIFSGLAQFDKVTFSGLAQFEGSSALCVQQGL